MSHKQAEKLELAELTGMLHTWCQKLGTLPPKLKLCGRRKVAAYTYTRTIKGLYNQPLTIALPKKYTAEKRRMSLIHELAHHVDFIMQARVILNNSFGENTQFRTINLRHDLRFYRCLLCVIDASLGDREKYCWEKEYPTIKAIGIAYMKKSH